MLAWKHGAVLVRKTPIFDLKSPKNAFILNVQI